MTPTDDMAFVGYPPLWRPEADEVHVSVAFSWDRVRGAELHDAWAQHYPIVRLGGPAFDGEGNGFEPGMYLRQGVTITSRGCVRDCPWCIVRGRIRLLDIKPGWIVQDNNLLATGRAHLSRVFDMLRRQKRAVTFAGGLDARLLKDWMTEEIRGLRVSQVFLAADTDDVLPDLRRALALLSFLPRDKKRCYVLWAFDGESLEAAENRCRTVWEMGAMPFPQLYQPIGGHILYSSETRAAARRWQRPAIMKGVMKTIPEAAKMSHLTWVL